MLAFCDFNMCFTFILTGWEESAHNTRLLKYATTNNDHSFPHPPIGKYYFFDVGFPLQQGFFKSFPNLRYHILDFQRTSKKIRGRKEHFNMRHSSLRDMIELAFGV